MKVAPRVHRKQSDPFCDQPRILDDAKRRRLPVDCNAFPGRGVDFCLHWETAAQNHYYYIWTGKRDRRGREIRRRMTKAELHRPVDQWDPRLVLRWRKTLSPVGPRKESKRTKAIRKHRPRTVAEMARLSKRKGVTIGWELKSRAYGTNPALAVRFKAAAGSNGARFFVMALASMLYWRQKLRNFHAVGVETLILVRGRKPADWATARTYITHRGAWG